MTGIKNNLFPFTDTNSVICKIIVGATDYRCHPERSETEPKDPFFAEYGFFDSLTLAQNDTKFGVTLQKRRKIYEGYGYRKKS